MPINDLKNPKEILNYLNTALQDNNPEVFLIALKSVIKAKHSSIAAFANEAKISKQSIYSALSPKQNLFWKSFVTLIKELGFEIRLAHK
jgi:probable addiction module antidote protein